jgi:rhamnose utilization protein RhaD (predicted bifunctional aldolase and dehydrogenase)
VSADDQPDRARFEALRAAPEFAALRAVSARLGADPAQVQAAGGNTSIKRDGAMWVKASGTWLAEAERRDVMVPVRAAALAEAVRAGEAAEAVDFVPEGLGAPGLRPSIETVVHASMPQPVVLHTHCVATIAVAIRADGLEVARARLGDLDPICAPYVMPGLPLCRALLAEAAPDRRVAVLGNHGLVAAGGTVAEAEATLREATRRLSGPAPAEAEGDPAILNTPRYRAAAAPTLHAVARDPARRAMAAAGPFYPDHVVFLGPRLAIAEPGEGVEAAAERLSEDGAPPLLILSPEGGAALRRDATPAQAAMARCLGDVIGRVEPGAALRPLTAGEVAALLGWDAEKQRQAANAGAR